MRAWLVLLALGCGSNKPTPTPTPVPVPSDAAVAGADASTIGCADPAPAPDYKCVQDCGPPVVRADDPPPAWHWLSPEQVKNREQFGCPRCLPPDTRIATPNGDLPISELTIGAPILTLDEHGRRVPARVLYIGATLTSSTHRIVRVTLADGRKISSSPGHPDATGRALGALALHDTLDGSEIVSVEDLPYSGNQTWDLLPSGPSGLYVADGVVLQSTFFTRSH
jgi:hypothetical protein